MKHWHMKRALLPGGWSHDVRVSAQAGVICHVEAGVALGADDHRLAIVLPGMGNTHSHAFQRAMSGLTERRGTGKDSFWTWRELVYRFVDRLNPDQLEAIAAFAYAEMLEEGFTRVGEFHYLHHDRDGRAYANRAEMSERLFAAAEQSGIAATLLPVFYAHAGFGAQPTTDTQRRFVNDRDGYARLISDARAAAKKTAGAVVGVAPHSLRAITLDQLTEILALVGGSPVHIHIAEQLREVEDCVGWSGSRPVRWLFDHAPVDERWCLVHATHMDDDEVSLLARSGAVAGLCPITEANLGDGLFPLAAYRAQGGKIAIGTDSNVQVSLTGELALLEYGQRLASRTRNVGADSVGTSTGGSLFRAALDGANEVLGGDIALTVGAEATFVALDLDHPALVARDGDDLIDSLIFGRSNGAVREVWSRGRQVVRDGLHVDRDVLAQGYRRVLGQILSN